MIETLFWQRCWVQAIFARPLFGVHPSFLIVCFNVFLVKYYWRISANDNNLVENTFLENRRKCLPVVDWTLNIASDSAQYGGLDCFGPLALWCKNYKVVIYDWAIDLVFFLNVNNLNGNSIYKHIIENIFAWSSLYKLFIVCCSKILF